MSVVFEEESKEIKKDNEIARARNNNLATVNLTKKMTVGQNVMMILFALVCGFAAYGVWHFKDGFYNPVPTLYKEDVDATHLKLIPEFDKEKFINSLPSKL